jgi:hypothetical protein
MPVNPGEQVLIKLFCANNVLLVIAFHQLPGLRVTGEAVNPKLVAGMAKLAPQPKRLSEVGSLDLVPILTERGSAAGFAFQVHASQRIQSLS